MNLEEAVRALIEKGDRQLNADDFKGAIRFHREAMELIPEPREESVVGLEAFVALGEAYFLAGRFEEAYGALSFAVKCPGGVENPLVWLRLGQVLYDVGDRDGAAQKLAAAYVLGGEEVFAGEDERYMRFLGTRMEI